MRAPRGFLSILLLLALLPMAATAEIYKHVDENGVIRYSDTPPSKDAKPVELPPLQTFSSGEGNVSDSSAEESPASILMRPTVAYTRLELTSPAPEQVYNQANPEVNASALLEPGLAVGHRVVFIVDGAQVPAPEGQTSVALGALERGSHTLQAVVMDSRDAVQIESDPINFHLHQPSRLRPGPVNPMPKLP